MKNLLILLFLFLWISPEVGAQEKDNSDDTFSLFNLKSKKKDEKNEPTGVGKNLTFFEGNTSISQFAIGAVGQIAIEDFQRRYAPSIAFSREKRFGKRFSYGPELGLAHWMTPVYNYHYLYTTLGERISAHASPVSGLDLYGGAAATYRIVMFIAPGSVDYNHRVSGNLFLGARYIFGKGEKPWAIGMEWGSNSNSNLRLSISRFH
ncbi:MAG: hypothetical protein AAFY71_21310 [Bacteroidota bacterium]